MQEIPLVWAKPFNQPPRYNATIYPAINPWRTEKKGFHFGQPIINFLLPLFSDIVQSRKIQNYGSSEKDANQPRHIDRVFSKLDFVFVNIYDRDIMQ